MTSKDEILADFQACSGIDDVGEAFLQLDAVDWNLQDALNNVLPQETQTIPTISCMDSDICELPLSCPSEVELISLSSTSCRPLDLGPSSFDMSEKSENVFNVNIQVISGESQNGTFPLEIPSSFTVGELKDMLHQIVGIVPCHQVLQGFSVPLKDDAMITKSVLPESRILTLNTLPSVSSIHNLVMQDDYHLLIHDDTTSKDYNLSYPSSKKVGEIKNDIYALTGIPVSQQIWSGWPNNCRKDDLCLGSTGIEKQHSLLVKWRKKEELAMKKVSVEDVNSSEEDFEDASDTLNDADFIDLIDMPSSNKVQPLIPEKFESDAQSIQNFIQEFVRRFGNCVPLFFHGTLEDAIQSSLVQPARNKKPLSIYLHHDGSVLSNVFCSQVLCQLSVIDCLSSNYIIWGWDLTYENNKKRLLKFISQSFGSVAESTVKFIGVDKLPVMLLITRFRGNAEIQSVIYGNSLLDEVLTSLLHVVELFEEQRTGEVFEEDARERRETEKAEQDAAYQASLEADRAKAAARREQTELENKERERQESFRQQEAAIKEAVKASLESDIPGEPDVSCPHPVTTLRFRAPGGKTFSRSFLSSTSLQVLLNYLYVQGYPADEFKCLQSWPRRDITCLDAYKSLADLGIPQQETLTLEER